MLAALLAAVPVLVHMQRDSVPYWDEWPFLLGRDGWSLHNLFANYNGHLMALTAIVLNLDREIFFAGAQAPLSVVSIALQLTIVWLVFVWVRRRVDAWVALGLAVIVLFFGSGYELLVWSFNVGWLASIAAGLGALCLFELPRSARRDLGVSALLLTSLAGSNVGLVFLAAIGIRAFEAAQRRRALSIVAAPAVLWAVWWLAADRHAGGAPGYFPKAWPHFILDEIAYAFGGPFGLLPSDAPDWGRALAVVAVIAALTALQRRGRLTAPLAAICSMPLVFWALTAVGRGGWAPASASRYTYTSFVLIALVFAELARGWRIRTSALAVGLAATWLLLLGANVSTLAAGAASERGGYELDKVHMTALLLAGEAVARNTRVDTFDGSLGPADNYPLYRWMIDQGGRRFAYRPAQLAADPAERAKVDAVVKQLGQSVAQQPSK